MVNLPHPAANVRGRLVVRIVRNSVSVNCDDSLSEQKYDEVVVVAEDVEGLIWHVKVGANLAGIVTSASGDPVGNANVRVQGVLGEDPRAQMSSAWAETEDDGSYESKGIAPGRAKLTVEAKGFPKNENNTDLEFIAGKTTRVDVTLDEGGTITGKVVDELSAPIKSVEIQTRNVRVARGWNMFGGSRSGDDGSFEVKGLEAAIVVGWPPRWRGSWWEGLVGERGVGSAMRRRVSDGVGIYDEKQQMCQRVSASRCGRRNQVQPHWCTALGCTWLHLVALGCGESPQMNEAVRAL